MKHCFPARRIAYALSAMTAMQSGLAVAQNPPLELKLDKPLVIETVIDPRTIPPAPSGAGGGSTTGGTLMMGSGAPPAGTPQGGPLYVSDRPGAKPAPDAPRVSNDLIFPRRGIYEAHILYSLGFGRFNRMEWPDGRAPAYAELTPLEQGLGTLALSAAELFFHKEKTLTAHHAFRKIDGHKETRYAIQVLTGSLVAAKLMAGGNDAVTTALNAWGSRFYQDIKIKSAESLVKEYERWKNNPCGYNPSQYRPAVCVSRIAGLIDFPEPPAELIAKGADKEFMSRFPNQAAVGAVMAASVLGGIASAAVLTTTLGIATQGLLVSSITGKVIAGLGTTSLYATLGGTGGASVGAAGIAGMVAFPVSMAALAAAGIAAQAMKLSAANEFEKMVYSQLQAARTTRPNLQAELQEQGGRDLFVLAFQAEMQEQKYVPKETPPPAPAPQFRWTALPGAGVDIGAGVNGALWVLGSKPVDGGFEIHRWNGNGWTHVPGGAVRIDVDPKGNAWVVNSGGMIFQYTGSAWNRLPGAARDIGVGADGSVWVIGTDPQPGGFGIWRWANGAWQKHPGAAVRIDVDARGNPWVVNSAGAIYQLVDGNWRQLPGTAKDIGVGANNSVFITGADNSVHRWSGSAWVKLDGALTDISVDGNGIPYGINAGRQIFMGSR